MRRLPVALATAALLALPSAASADTVVKTPLTFDVATGAPGAETPCTITADLYKPGTASKANPVPAILATNGFGGSKADFDKLGAAYAARGYGFLAYSGLGFGGSSCKITLDDRDHDGRAGSQLVSFLGGSKAAKDGTRVDWVLRDAKDHDGVARTDDPRVGMTGGSYGGQIQFAVAGVDPRVDALNPQITWNDLEYSLAGNNTDIKSGVTSATPGVAKLDWPTLFTGVGIQNGFQAAITNGDSSHLDGTCPNFADQVCPGLVNAAARGYADPATSTFLRAASVATYLDKIKVPTFLAQGEHDTLFNLQESVATYRALRAQGTPTKLLFRSAGHSGGGLGAQESSSTALEGSYESRMSLEWFDFYLRGLGDAPKLDFSFLRDWALPKTGDGAPAVGSTPSYPAATTTPFNLSGADGLVGAGAPVQAGSQTIAVTPVPTSSGGAALAGVPSGDTAPGTFASWTTPVLAGDLDVAGLPTLTVSLDAPTFAATQGGDAATKLVLFAKVEDVAPDGSASIPAEIVSSSRIADVTKPVRLELAGIVHRFAKGHRLRVTLTASNALRRGNAVAGPVTVSTSPTAPSVLTIPRLGTAPGAAGSGPSGTTPYPAGPEALPVQAAGLGRPAASTPAAAKLPSSKPCASRRAFPIRLRAPKGDKVRSATITVNGKRKATVRGSRRSRVNLKGLPKGTVRVLVTVRTTKGRVLRSARTYRTCVPKKRR